MTDRPLIRASALGLATLILAASPAVAQRDDARPRDLQRLQEDLRNLDDELAALEPRDAKAEELRQRAEEIREETVYLKVKMRRHQRAAGEGAGVSYDEVADLRRSIADLREDIAAASSRDAREARIPEGTEILLRLEEPLSSKTARREDRFEASVQRPVRADGVLAIPAGSRVRGIVREAQPAERPSRGGRLEMDFDALYLGSQRLDLRSRVVAIQEREEDQLDTREKAGIGAVLGGVLGGILGGRKGAIVGILVGGTGAVVGSKGDEVELPAGTVIHINLERPLVLPRR